MDELEEEHEAQERLEELQANELKKQRGVKEFNVDRDGDDWFTFSEAVQTIEQLLSYSAGRAEKMLRELCASGEVRSLRVIYTWVEGPSRVVESATFIRPSEWRTTEVDFEGDIDVSGYDLKHWLGQQPSVQLKEIECKVRWEPIRTQQGKVPRIITLLAKRHPEGVPDPAFCPRQTLLGDVIKADPGLKGIDMKTLSKAIKEHNASVGKRTEVDGSPSVSD
jgi:hypothetical protein